MSPIDKPLNNESIASFLNENVKCAVEKKIYLYDTIDSTNVEAKRLLKKGLPSSHATILAAEHQTAGKGRLGRSFYSPQSRGIYLSIIYDGKMYSNIQKDTVEITVIAAVAVRRALKEFGVEANIKWVNDLFVGNKKVCGILTEGVFSTNENGLTAIESYVIGIGINVLESKEGFPDEIKNIAGSLNKNIDRNKLIGSIVNNLFLVLAKPPIEVIKEYRKYSNVLNKLVTVIKPTIQYSARVLEITDEAHLIVELEDGSKEELLSGEISLRV